MRVVGLADEHHADMAGPFREFVRHRPVVETAKHIAIDQKEIPSDLAIEIFHAARCPAYLGLFERIGYLHAPF